MAAFRQKMKSEESKAIYRRRGEVAEFPNAWIKEKLGLRKFRVRGLGIGVADLFESLFHLVNPATAKEALGGLNRGLLFRSGKDWRGFRGLAGEAGRRAWGGTRSAWNMSY